MPLSTSRDTSFTIPPVPACNFLSSLPLYLRGSETSCSTAGSQSVVSTPQSTFGSTLREADNELVGACSPPPPLQRGCSEACDDDIDDALRCLDVTSSPLRSTACEVADDSGPPELLPPCSPEHGSPSPAATSQDDHSMSTPTLGIPLTILYTLSAGNTIPDGSLPHPVPPQVVVPTLSVPGSPKAPQKVPIQVDISQNSWRSNAITKTQLRVPSTAATPVVKEERPRNPNVDPGLYKVKMCRNILKSGTCPYGEHCVFAHNPNEMRSKETNLDVMKRLFESKKPLVNPLKYKVKPCQKWKDWGHCPYEPHCVFAHGDDELRTEEQNKQVAQRIQQLCQYPDGELRTDVLRTIPRAN